MRAGRSGRTMPRMGERFVWALVGAVVALVVVATDEPACPEPCCNPVEVYSHADGPEEMYQPIPKFMRYTERERARGVVR